MSAFLTSFFRVHGSPFRCRSTPRLRRAASLAIAVVGGIAVVPAQINFSLSGCYSNGANAPFALALGDTGGPATLEMAAAHNSFFTTGVDTWSPGAGTCPVFGPVTALAFGVPAPLAPVTNVVDVAIADINNAGAGEVCALVWDPLAPYVEVFDGGPQRVALPPTFPFQLVTTDFDGDGDIDLLVLDSTSTIHLSKNGPVGTFGAFAPLPLALVPAGLGAMRRFAVGSFNNDNLPDLVVTWGAIGFIPPQAAVLSNTGGTGATYQLLSTCTFPLPTNPGGITVGDFDGNGVDDFVVIDGGLLPGSNSVFVCTTPRILPWPGTIVVAQATVTLPASWWPTAITSGDYDCDGDIDLAYAYTDGRLHFRPNEGGGTFPGTGLNVEVSYAIFGGITDIETGDIDGDGDLDVATCDWVPGGGCCVWCNLLPPGECCHEFRGGDRTDTYVGIDCACPSANLATVAAPLRQFDDAALAKTFAHTFEGLPVHIRSAKLTIVWKPIGPAAPDLLKLDLQFAPTNFALDYSLANTGPPVVLDLAHLPGGQNLLPRLQKVGRLDVAGALHTQIDSMRLDIITCCEDSEPTIGYTHDELRAAGGVVNFTINAGAAYANGFGIIGFGAGVGCLGAGSPFEGVCILPPYSILLLAPLDAFGTATLSAFIPIVPCCLELHSQALAIKSNWSTPYGFSCTISDYTK